MGGRCPGMTTAEIMGKLYREEGEDVQSLFNPPKRQPTDGEKKIMLAQVVRVAMLAVLQNHTYHFNKVARLQSDGGPIGLELAGAMARVVMLWCDRKFLKLAELNHVEIFMYKRYIDDENMALKPLPPGTRWVQGPWLERFGAASSLSSRKVVECRDIGLFSISNSISCRTSHIERIR